MTDPFTQMAAVISASQLAVAVTYTPAGGAAQPMTWVFFEKQPQSRLNDLRTSHDGPTADVAAQFIAVQPQPGDAFVMGARTFSVKKAELDTGGLFWIIELVEVFP